MIPCAVYHTYAEDYGTAWGQGRAEARCYLCLGVDALHLEGTRFACWRHCCCKGAA